MSCAACIPADISTAYGDGNALGQQQPDRRRQPSCVPPACLARDTRLLTTALVAVLTLWVLARMRFPDRPPTPNPVPPILEQLTAPPTFSDLADRVADARTRLVASLLSVAVVDDAAATIWQ